MSCWNKEQLEQMLEDVVNALDLSAAMIVEHGPMGTPPADLVRLVLAEKATEIARLTAKCSNSLANNLCPDHRDKQAGKSCLACEVDRLAGLVEKAFQTAWISARNFVVIDPRSHTCSQDWLAFKEREGLK